VCVLLEFLKKNMDDPYYELTIMVHDKMVKVCSSQVLTSYTCAGRILSDWMSIRFYCMTQLRTVWLHMRTNMGLGDDERSFFIMRAMNTLFTVHILDFFFKEDLNVALIAFSRWQVPIHSRKIF